MKNESSETERTRQWHDWLELYLKLVWALLTTVWLVNALAQTRRDLF
ncbi:MAG: hypothetical protein M3209_00170 [Acidobacteriota bacterium]|nr:hypothetical protein [Acidobacteriota bacterium]